jgi:hypothetical protein
MRLGTTEVPTGCTGDYVSVRPDTTKTFRTKSKVKLHIGGRNMSHRSVFINCKLYSVAIPTEKVLSVPDFSQFLEIIMQ